MEVSQSREGFGQDWETPYGTTVFVIVFLCLVYVVEWKQHVALAQVHVSRELLFDHKRFHRILTALLSHPPPYAVEATFAGQTPSSREIPWGIPTAHPSQQLLRRYHRTLQETMLRLRAFFGLHTFSRLMHPFLSTHFASGLPLVIYTIHILWQCRLLEPLYDLAYDKHHWAVRMQAMDPSDALAQTMIRSITAASHSNGNLSDALQQDGALQPFLTGQVSYLSLTQHDTEANSTILSILQQFYRVPFIHLQYGPYSYFRVLVTLALISLLLPIGVSQMIRRYHWSVRQVPWIILPNSDSTTPATSSSSSSSIREPKMCTLTSTLIALLYLHSFHFPHVAIAVLPFLPISISHPLFKILLPVGILVLLYRRLYRLAHHTTSGVVIWNGILTAVLWEWNIIQFIALQYWGHWFMGFIILASMLSLKACTMYSGANTGPRLPISIPVEEQPLHYEPQDALPGHSNSPWNNWMTALLSWIDYVSWDEEGKISHGPL